MKAEIQVRTGSQHIWAAASHILQYKKETHVPVPLRRTINRVAALLETVDLEFERVLVERKEYTEGIRPQSEDLPLNTESLRSLLDSSLPEKNRKEGDENYAEILDELVHFNIKTTNQLRSIFSRHLSAAIEEDQRSLKRALNEIKEGKEPLGTTRERSSLGVYFTHVGLTRDVLFREFGQAFREYQSNKAGQPAHALE